MENQMTALSSISIEESTLSVLLVEALKGIDPNKYKSTSDLAAEAVKSAFSKLRGQNNVGEVTVGISVNVDDHVLQSLSAIVEKINTLDKAASKERHRLTEVITILSDSGHRELIGR